MCRERLEPLGLLCTTFIGLIKVHSIPRSKAYEYKTFHAKKKIWVQVKTRLEMLPL